MNHQHKKQVQKEDRIYYEVICRGEMDITNKNQSNQNQTKLSREEFIQKILNDQLEERGIKKESDEFLDQQPLIQRRIDFISLMPKGGLVAEIGVHKGFFTNCILHQNQPEKLHLIDPWFLIGKEWDWGEKYNHLMGNKSTVDALIGILDYYRKELIEGKLMLHVGWSEEVLAQFEDDYFDWVYLDTSHEYEETLRELEILKSKVKATGVIAGDDLGFPKVEKAVKEFAKKEDYTIIYEGMTDEGITDGQWAMQKANPELVGRV